MNPFDGPTAPERSAGARSRTAARHRQRRRRRARRWRWPVLVAAAVIGVAGVLPHLVMRLATDSRLATAPDAALVAVVPSPVRGALVSADDAPTTTPPAPPTTAADTAAAERASSRTTATRTTATRTTATRATAAEPERSVPAVPAPELADRPQPGGGGRWLSGVVVGTPDQAKAWGEFRGRAVEVVHAFTERGSWEEIETAGWILGFYADHPAELVISQPFWPEGSGGSLDACATGAYDGHWRSYGTALTRAGRTDAFTRLAWEFNGDWFEWSATDVDAWKGCFRSVVDAVRSTAPDARFEWNMNAHGSATSDGDAWKSYPGDRYVDIVGIDPYDHYPTSPTPASFAEQCHANEGLCTVMEFARAHGKKVGVTEWGVIDNAGGGGDNPVYIQQMYETFAANRDVMGYETYFNEAEYGNALHAPRQNPRSSDTYVRLFGG